MTWQARTAIAAAIAIGGGRRGDGGAGGGDQTGAAGAPRRRRAGVQRAPFGKLADGSAVEIFTLTNASKMEVRVINYGAIIVSIRVPDRAGQFDDVVLGHDNLEGYVSRSRFFGAVAGRYANRIAGAPVQPRRPGVQAGRQQRAELTARRHEGLRQGRLGGVDRAADGGRARRDVQLHERGRRRGLSRHDCRRR